MKMKKFATALLAACLLTTTGVATTSAMTTMTSYSSSSSITTNADGTQVTRTTENGYAMNMAGDTLTLSLKSNPTTGYSWVVSGLDKTAIDLTNQSYAQDNQSMGGEPMLGVGGTDTFQFKAKKPGQTTFTMTYKQDWKGGDEGQAYTVTALIDDQKSFAGFSMTGAANNAPSDVASTANALDQALTARQAVADIHKDGIITSGKTGESISDSVVIVSLDRNFTDAEAVAFAKKHNMTVVYNYRNFNMCALKLKTPAKTMAEMEKITTDLEKDENVLMAQPDHIMYIM